MAQYVVEGVIADERNHLERRDVTTSGFDSEFVHTLPTKLLTPAKASQLAGTEEKREHTAFQAQTSPTTNALQRSTTAS